MKQLLSLFLFLVPCLALAQYPSNGNQKITLGEQTTADGLIWRGVASDTTLTAKSDTAAYLVLDTVNLNLYTYKASASGKKWIQLGSDTTSLNLVSRFAAKLNISDTASMLTNYYRSGRTGIIQATDVPTLNQNTTGSAATLTTSRTFQTNLASTSTASFNGSANVTPGVTGTLPVANGGTGATTLSPNNYLIRTNSSGIFDTSAIYEAGGNVGIRVIPSAWVSTARVIDIGTFSSFFQDSDGYPQMSFNAYESASDVYRYKLNDLSTRYRQWNGNHQWFTAPSGTAGDVISFTQAMTLGTNSGLSIGTASAAPANGLLVGGAATFSGALTVNNAQITQSSNSGLGVRQTFVSSSLNGRIYSIGSNFVVGNGEFSIYDETAGVERFKIAPTGAATFSSSVTATGYNSQKNGSATVSSQYQLSSVSGTIYSANMQLGATGSLDFWTYDAASLGWGKYLSLASTGAATFSGEINQRATGNVTNKFESTTNTGRFIQSFSNDAGAAFQQGVFGSNNSQTLFGRTASNIAFLYTTAFIATHPSVFVLGTFSAQDFILGTNNTQRIGIASGGAVTIGSSTPQSGYRLTVVDSVYVGGNVSASAYTTRSDFNLKDDIFDIKYGLNDILKLQPVEYTYKSNGSKQLGFIAQDIGTILPEVVSFEESMSVNYQAIIPILTKAIQEQTIIIKQLEERIKKLEER